ncbi:uncharacterized protein [Triticum aestivum]|uniref:uncharacterized protein isoform X3 n=1 Tax=Triticum aestivum TaxID=4565 RepID=UPI001D02CDFC|nr:uncharacterized protein LOC123060301 isoform X3 [Triticum aestivum]
MAGDGEEEREGKRRREMIEEEREGKRRRGMIRDGSPSPSPDANPEQAAEAVEAKGNRGVASSSSRAGLLLPNYEFGWHICLFVGSNRNVDIMASVRSQYRRTCSLCAILSTAEQDILRNLALEEPDRQPDIYFDCDTYQVQYEIDVGAEYGREAFSSIQDRPVRLLNIFQRDGVRAYSRSREWSGGKMIKISNVRWYTYLTFRDFENIIANGRPIVGGFPIGDEFENLGPEEIYEFSPVHIVRQPAGFHMVLFVGTGSKDGREFVAFLNSKGDRFGKKGVGKVYFDQLIRCFYTLECRAPPPPLPSGSSDLVVAGPGDNDDTLGSSGTASDVNNMSSFSNAPDGDNAQSSTSPTQSLSQAGKSNKYDDDPVSSSCAIETERQVTRVDGWAPTAPAVLNEDVQTGRCALVVKAERMLKELKGALPVFLFCVLTQRRNCDIYGPWRKKKLHEMGFVPSNKMNGLYFTNVLLKISDKHVRSRCWPMIPRYMASISTQFPKVERINSVFKQLGDGSDDAIINRRDGVSGSQFSQVLSAKLNQVIKRELSTIIIDQRNYHMEILQADAPDNVPSGLQEPKGTKAQTENIIIWSS